MQNECNGNSTVAECGSNYQRYSWPLRQGCETEQHSKGKFNDKTKTWFRSIANNQNHIVIRGCIDNKVCILQLCPQSGKGSLHYKTSEEALESRDLLTKLDKSWGEMMTFEGTNCDLKNLVRFQRTVKSFLDVAES